MKNHFKLVIISSLLCITCLFIAACGSGDAENFVQGKGQIDVTVTNSSSVPLQNIKIDVRVDSITGRIVDTWTTDATGKHTFQETIGSDYFFTFTDAATPVRYATQNYSNNPVKPLLTSTVQVNVTMTP